MAQGKQRTKYEEEEIGLLLKRKRKPEPEVDRKAGGNRFPTRSDGSSALGFATLSHSNLKSWAQVRDAQGHNTRTIDTPNAREGAPEPIELLDEQSGTYIERVKAVLVAHDVPVRIRKGGTIATEDVYGASPEYWNGDGDWKRKPVDEIVNDPVVQAAVAHARRKHGRRLVSCSLHIDEESPHIHVIAVPLVFREHAIRGPKPKDCKLDENGKPIDYRPKVGKWSLDVSSERGLSSQLERNHDAWAAACEDFGLVRGERGSDMTLEAKRARRNSQTGRASMAEKEAREKREGLERAAHEFNERAEANDKVAKKLLEEAAAEKAAAEDARQEAERSRKAQLALETTLNELIASAHMTKAEADADRETAANLKKSLEIRESKLETALTFVSDILDPEIDVSVTRVDGAMTLTGKYDPQDALSLQDLPGPLYAGVASLLSETADRKQHQAQLGQARQQVESDRKQLNSERETYNNAREKLLKVRSLASEFHTVWLAIPPSERSPEVNAGAEAAQALEDQIYPPGFPALGKGGAEIG